MSIDPDNPLARGRDTRATETIFTIGFLVACGLFYGIIFAAISLGVRLLMGWPLEESLVLRLWSLIAG